MGQILSCRDNLFPSSWIEAMEKLQDQVPARRGEDALQLAYEAMGGKEEFDRIFKEFDPEPLAAASLGQVHKAVLRENLRLPNTRDATDGVVAVKVQRAKLRQIYDQDLVVMNKIAAAMDKMGNARANVGGVSQSWVEIFRDAEAILYREIDYRDEAVNARRFANDFGLDIGGKPLQRSSSTTSRNDEPPVATSKDGEALPSASGWLRTPYVYTDLSSEKVLVMEFVPSIKVTNKAKLEGKSASIYRTCWLDPTFASFVVIFSFRLIRIQETWELKSWTMASTGAQKRVNG
jgi:predicted unusual protein kinase regulating ubiquinone biosynthesis (AarF/ABC1/UbiB family)